MEHALELMPEIVGDESVGIKYAINGLLSLTPDGMPVLGETPEVAGLWAASAVWVKEGPGVGRALAQWMVEGEPEIELQASDVARFHEHQKSVAHVKARASEHFNKTYGIVHPGEQWDSDRRLRLSPFYERPPTSAPSSTRPPAGSARTGTSRTPASSRSTAWRAARRSGTRAGGRPSSTPSTSRCATAPRCSTSPPSACSTWSARARSTPCSAWPCARWT